MELMRANEITVDNAKLLSDFVFERKYDGSRALVIDGDIYSEREICRNDRFPQIHNELKGINATFDGEIFIEGKCVLDLNAKKNWREAKFCVFDILSYNGIDLRNKPLLDRKRILTEVISGEFKAISLPQSWSSLDTAWNEVLNRNLEGLMAKNLNSPYEMRRTSTWLKIKRRRCIDVEILSHEIGSTKGTFIIKMPSGVEARVSGTSEDIVKFYNEHKPKKMEINYMYLTPSGFPFQPTFSKFIGDVI